MFLIALDSLLPLWRERSLDERVHITARSRRRVGCVWGCTESVRSLLFDNTRLMRPVCKKCLKPGHWAGMCRSGEEMGGGTKEREGYLRPLVMEC
jgi:hypothetical protein